ncbi:cutinase family protein [Micromonospora sp. NPDC051196]|uniref:cutinase family protein n=1 Tax=Micromonospora sp. NPDC051196 TaxID=3155281 RepID=UPI0034202A56
MVIRHRRSAHARKGTVSFIVAALVIAGLAALPGSAAAEGEPCSVPGTVCSWGNNATGALGTGNTISSFVPVVVPGLDHVTSLAAGSTPTGQSYAYALRSDGSLYAWGYGGHGQLMDGTSDSSTTPRRVTAFDNVRAVAAGGWGGMGYAILDDGTAWAVGAGGLGQLGDGSTGIGGPPVKVNLTDVQSIAVGGYTTYALRSDGTVWSWGMGDHGELGNGTWGDGRRLSVSSPVQVSNLTNVRAIAASYSAGYALRADGTVWAWGKPHGGALADGTPNVNNWNPMPTLVPKKITGLADVTAIASNFAGITAYALRSDGTVWSWGKGEVGQLGDGRSGTDSIGASQVDHFSSLPVQVQGLLGAVAIGAGSSVGYAILSDGSARSWGGNYDGRLGIGTETKTGPGSTVPVRIDTLTRPSAIVATHAAYALIGVGGPVTPPSAQVLVTPTTGFMGTNFTATYACTVPPSATLTRSDGQPVRGAHLLPPVTGNRTTYTQRLRLDVVGEYVLRVTCGARTLVSPRLSVQPTPTICRDAALIGVRGSYDNGQGTSYPGGRAQEIAKQLMGQWGIRLYDADGGGDGVVGVKYPAVIWTAPTYASSVNAGVRQLLNEIDFLHTQCGPLYPVLLTGFSQGSHVIQSTLEQLSDRALQGDERWRAIAGVALLASPRFNSDDVVARGTFAPNYPGDGIAGAASIGTRFRAITRTYCIANDPVCVDQRRFPKNIGVHTSGYNTKTATGKAIIKDAAGLLAHGVGARRGSAATPSVTGDVRARDLKPGQVLLSAAEVFANGAPTTSFRWDLNGDGRTDRTTTGPLTIFTYQRVVPQTRVTVRVDLANDSQVIRCIRLAPTGARKC